MQEKDEKRIQDERPVTVGYLDMRLDQFKGELKTEIMDDMREEMRAQTVEILQSVDKILIRFDAAEKDHAAHDMLHTRITDDLHGHDMRIKKLEARV